jgi:hypothetical protein
MKRIVTKYSHVLDATPDRVFPLLCPVREYDWLPYWSCRMMYTESGIAELDCIFQTTLPEEPEAIWMCSRYEPDQAIDYVVLSPGLQVHHLSIRLSQPAPSKTRLDWTRTYTALTPEAEARLMKFVDSRLGQINEILTISLAHYLATGTLWKSTGAAAC